MADKFFDFQTAARRSTRLVGLASAGHNLKPPSYEEIPPETYGDDDTIQVSPRKPETSSKAAPKSSRKSPAQKSTTKQPASSLANVSGAKKRKRPASTIGASTQQCKRARTTTPPPRSASEPHQTSSSRTRGAESTREFGDSSGSGLEITSPIAALTTSSLAPTNTYSESTVTLDNDGPWSDDATKADAQLALVASGGRTAVEPVVVPKGHAEEATATGDIPSEQQSIEREPPTRYSSPLSTPPSSPRLDQAPNLTPTSASLNLVENDYHDETDQRQTEGESSDSEKVQLSDKQATPGPNAVVSNSEAPDDSSPEVHQRRSETPAANRAIQERAPKAHTPVRESEAIAEHGSMGTPNRTLNVSATSQLLTPPTSVHSSDASHDEAPAARRSRQKKAPKRHGDYVEPSSVIEVAREISTSSDQKDAQDDESTPSKKAEAKSKSKNPLTGKASKPSAKKPTLTQKAGVAKPKKAQSSTKTVAKSKAAPKSSDITKSIARKTPRQAAPQKTEQKTAKAGPEAVKKGNGRKGTKQKDTLIVKVPLPQSLLEIKVDPVKLALSQKLTHRESLESGLKPQPQLAPPVWAESRQALCETLPYFKRPQGGCYQNDGHVYGFLFDGVGHCREYVDNDVIICRAGGGMEPDPSGGMVQRKDQSMKEAQVQAILNDIAHHNPLIVICGNRNKAALCKMPHQYCVLGWYKPVAVWSEKTAGKGTKVWNTVKYRLERLNRHKPAWHAPKEHQISEEEKSVAGDLHEKGCEKCGTNYPQIYLQGWMCLNADCGQFWKINGRDATCGGVGLDYNPAFLLHESELWKDGNDEDEPEPSDVRPEVPKVGNVIGDNLAYVNTRGICCPWCGRCNPRRFFKGWWCEKPGCGYKEEPEHRLVAPAMLHTPWDSAPTLVRNRHQNSVHIQSKHLHGYKLSIYTFDGIKGRFVHAAASKRIVEEKNGPNEMFAAIQTEDMELERRNFAIKKMGGKADKQVNSLPTEPLPSQEELIVAEPSQSQEDAEPGEEESTNKQEFADGDLMTAFSMNYGMPYKFVASGASKPFEEAPWPVTECRDRLNKAQRAFLDELDNDKSSTESTSYEAFNEELIFAYLEGQKIEYHDDGEEGLGPRIATLSLGGRAKMHMRMKLKHHVGCSKTGVFTEDKPVPGGIGGAEMDKQRMERWDELQRIKDDSPAYTKRRKEIPKELGIFEKRMKKADDLVTVTLSHGDIILMDGYDIQKYLEHKVVPEGYLRFALTCRTVTEDHLKLKEHPT